MAERDIRGGCKGCLVGLVMASWPLRRDGDERRRLGVIVTERRHYAVEFQKGLSFPDLGLSLNNEDVSPLHCLFVICDAFGGCPVSLFGLPFAALSIAL